MAWTVTAHLATAAAIDGKVGKGQLVFNVMDYGATGNGTTDDTAAIQAAIDAASPTKATAFFPPGTYRLATLTGTANLRRFLTLSAGVTLQGASATASVLKAGNATAPFFTLLGGSATGTDLTGLTVKDLGFDLNTTNNAPAANQVSILDYRAAVVVYTGARVTIRNCRITDSCGVWGFTVNATGATDTIIEGNRLEWASSAVFHDTSAVYVSGIRTQIRGNHFVATAGTPLAFTAIETHGDDQVITGNIISGWFRGANLTGVGLVSNGISFAHNTIKRCGIGVELWSTAAGLSGGYGLINTTVDHNPIDVDYDAWPTATISGPRAGVMLNLSSDYGVKNLAITNNEISFRPITATLLSGDLASAGVALYRATAVSGITDQTITVTGNTIDAPPGPGIYVQLKSIATGVRFNGNTIHNPASGAATYPDIAYRAGIKIQAAAGNGYELRDLTVDRNLMVDDRVTAVMLQGVDLVHCAVPVTDGQALGNTMRVADAASTAQTVKQSGTAAATINTNATTTLTDAATITTDASRGTYFRVAIAADRTLGAPSNAADGQRVLWEVTASGAQRALALTTGSAGAFALTTSATSPITIASGGTAYIGAIYSSVRSRWIVIALTTL